MMFKCREELIPLSFKIPANGGRSISKADFDNRKKLFVCVGKVVSLQENMKRELNFFMGGKKRNIIDRNPK